MYTEEQVRRAAAKRGMTEEQITKMLATLPTLISQGLVKTDTNGRMAATRVGKNVLAEAKRTGRI